MDYAVVDMTKTTRVCVFKDEFVEGEDYLYFKKKNTGKINREGTNDEFVSFRTFSPTEHNNTVFTVVVSKVFGEVVSVNAFANSEKACEYVVEWAAKHTSLDGYSAGDILAWHEENSESVDYLISMHESQVE